MGRLVSSIARVRHPPPTVSRDCSAMTMEKGRRLLVIGGSPGIGFATAAPAAAAGASVTIGSRSAARLADAAGSPPPGVATKMLDLTDVPRSKHFSPVVPFGTASS